MLVLADTSAVEISTGVSGWKHWRLYLPDGRSLPPSSVYIDGGRQTVRWVHQDIEAGRRYEVREVWR